jgi:hypothetical protein
MQKANSKKNMSKGTTYLLICFIALIAASCGVYKFNDTGGMDFTKVKTIKVGFIDNKAAYVNPQLAPKFTDRLQLRVLTGTKLTRVTDDNADIVVNATIRNYDATQTVGINGQQATINRLTVTVVVNVIKNYENAKEDFTVSRSFDFPANLSLQQAEGALLDDVVKNLSDEIFNKIFSNW